MKIKVVILAAGKGKRMNSSIPKALTLVGGKPILQYLYDSILESKIDDNPVVVIGPEKQRLCESFGGVCKYAVQEQQLGTGHAVNIAKNIVGDSDAVIVLNGDEPFVSAHALQKLAKRHSERGNTITMMTTIVPSFDGWHEAFEQWGRILRCSNGHILGIREFKDATDKEKTIRELNPSLFCFDAKWLWENIDELGNSNAQKEYYLTDLIQIAVEQGKKLSSIDVAPEEVVGINTQEELKIAEDLLQKRN